MILGSLVVANLKMLLRNRQSLFWALAFPLVFVGIFGLFNLDEPPTITLGVVDYAQDDVSRNLIASLDALQTFEVEMRQDEAAARKDLTDGDLRYLMVIPEGLSASVQSGTPARIDFTFDEGSPVSAVVLGVVQKFLDDVNLRLVQAPAPLVLAAQGTKSKDLDYFDFLLPGFVGMGVMTYSIIGVASIISVYRQQKILKRIRATPLSVRTFFSSMIIAHLVLSLVQTAVILAAGIFILDGDVLGNYLYIAVFVLLGNTIFLNLGFIVGAFSPNVGAASGLGNAVTMPLMFFSGVFFPTDSLPAVMEHVVKFLPLAPMLDGMRGVSLDAKSLTDFPLELGLLAAWIAITSFVATRVFRFD